MRLNHLLPALLLTGLACGGAMDDAVDKAQDRLEEEATEALAEKLLGLEAVEVDQATGAVSFKAGDLVLSADGNGMSFADATKGLDIKAGDRASIPADFPWTVPADAQIAGVATGVAEGRTMTTVSYTLRGTSVEAQDKLLGEAASTDGYTLNAQRTPNSVNAVATKGDAQRVYQIADNKGSITVTLAQLGAATEAANTP